MKKIYIVLLSILLSIPYSLSARTVEWYNGGSLSYEVQKKHDNVVEKALEIFASDIHEITGKKVKDSKNGKVLIYQLNTASNKDMKALGSMRVPVMDFITKKDAYWIGVRGGKIVIVGSNGRGTAYGLMHLSELCGVNPWMDWMGVKPEHKTSFNIDDSFETLQAPSVPYRGISLINTNQSIAFYSHLMKLMLRLKLNVLCTGIDGHAAKHVSHHQRNAVDSFGVALAVPRNGNDIHIMGRKKTHNVTINWHDDGYGYVSPYDEHNDDDGGLVYHLSYKGQPHDYLWLSTTQPGLISNELKTAFDHGADELWLAVVNNPTVAAYPLSLFTDMAWDADTMKNADVRNHLKGWIGKLFGHNVASQIGNSLCEYYRLVGMRKPETMDFSRQQQPSRHNRTGDSGQKVTMFNAEEFGNELERYLNNYRDVSKKVSAARGLVGDRRVKAYFTMVEYPVVGSALLSDKVLQGQESKLIGRPASFHHDDEALESAARSIMAYRKLNKLTKTYNNIASTADWIGKIDASPRNLEVFGEPILTDTVSDAEVEKYYTSEPVYAPLQNDGCVVRNASDYSKSSSSSSVKIVELLGHSAHAIELQKNDSLSYDFYTDEFGGVLRLAFVPTQSPDGTTQQVLVSVDGASPTTVVVSDASLGERWADAVLRGQWLVTLPVSLSQGNHTLKIKSLGSHVVFDQWMIDKDTNREFYLFPVR